MTNLTIKTKRIYEDPGPEDGYRVLVDRLWPRGVSKEEARLDERAKELAPTDELRQWFDHDPERWEEFRRRYRSELADRREAARELLDRADSSEDRVTLLYAARDRDHNHALVLRSFLQKLQNETGGE